MALANIAELLYQAGMKVLMVDWDLEAPGLERFFPLDIDKTLEKRGVMDMLLGYKQKMAQEPPNSKGKKFLPFEKPDPFIIDIYPNTTHEGKLWLLPAGRRSKDNFAEYANNVLNFNWYDFYQNWEGELYLDWIREQFERIADVVLIDSRTGVTEMSGVCTYQLADTVVMLCAANQQCLHGTYKMAQNFRDPEVKRLRRGRHLNVLIIPARIERAESDLLNKFQKDFIKLFKDFVPHTEEIDIWTLWRSGIPYIPRYAFTEALAVREKGRASAEDMVDAFNRLNRAMKHLANLQVEKLTPLKVSEKVTRLRVFVASPGDVSDERDSLKDVIDELNHGIAENKGLMLQFVGWETDAWPGFGEDAQDVINREIDPYDIFIGIMWKRFGTPTKRSGSGIEEEFEQAYSLWLEYGRPRLMLYFKKAPFFPSSKKETEQMNKILDFKKKVKDEGVLYWEYDDPNKFKRLLKEHLIKEILRWESYVSPITHPPSF